MGVWDVIDISWTICKQSAPCSRQTTTQTRHHSIFSDQMLFLAPSQQRQSTVGMILAELFSEILLDWLGMLQSCCTTDMGRCVVVASNEIVGVSVSVVLIVCVECGLIVQLM